MNLVIVLHFFHLFKSVRIWQACWNLLSAQDYALGLFFMNRGTSRKCEAAILLSAIPDSLPVLCGFRINHRSSLLSVRPDI